MTRTLVVYYADSQATRRTAAGLAELLCAETEEIQAEGLWNGPVGTLQRLYYGSSRQGPPISLPHHRPYRFDLVVICAPLWAGRVAAPVRSYLLKMRHRLPAVGFLVASDWDGAQGGLSELARLTGRRPLAETGVGPDDHHCGAALPKLQAFTSALLHGHGLLRPWLEQVA